MKNNVLIFNKIIYYIIWVLPYGRLNNMLLVDEKFCDLIRSHIITLRSLYLRTALQKDKIWSSFSAQIVGCCHITENPATRRIPT